MEWRSSTDSQYRWRTSGTGPAEILLTVPFSRDPGEHTKPKQQSVLGSARFPGRIGRPTILCRAIFQIVRARHRHELRCLVYPYDTLVTNPGHTTVRVQQNAALL